MDGGGHVDRPTGQEAREERGPPEQQSGSADDGHAPEDGKVVELLPVGPAAVVGTRALPHKPFEGAAKLLPVAAVEKHALRAGEEPAPRQPAGAALAAHVPQV